MPFLFKMCFVTTLLQPKIF